MDVNLMRFWPSMDLDQKVKLILCMRQAQAIIEKAKQKAKYERPYKYF